MVNEDYKSRELKPYATVGLEKMKDDADFQSVGETMTAFSVPAETVIEFPPAAKFAAWIRLFKGNKIPYISGLKITNDKEWLEIPSSVFRVEPIQEDMEEFKKDNEFGMILRSKERDFNRWEVLAGKKVKFTPVPLRAVGFDRETNTPITDPKKCKERTFYKVSTVK